MKHLFEKMSRGQYVARCGKSLAKPEHFTALPAASNCPRCWMAAKDFVMSDLQKIYGDQAEKIFKRVTAPKPIDQLLKSGLSQTEANILKNTHGPEGALEIRKRFFIQAITDLIVTTVLTPGHETHVVTVALKSEKEVAKEGCTPPSERSVTTVLLDSTTVSGESVKTVAAQDNCFFCQSPIEFQGIYPGAIKSVLHSKWICTRHNSHQLVCESKGAWAYWWGNGMAKVTTVPSATWMIGTTVMPENKNPLNQSQQTWEEKTAKKI